MERIVESIVFYLFFVFHPRALVKIVRDYRELIVEIPKRIAETSRAVTGLSQTIRDIRSIQSPFSH
jgi:hypothetical protein